jgi:hypothetical protein
MFTVMIAVVVGSVAPQAAPPALAGPEERALAWLAREVPRWSRKHHCYSCHHNGDAARALYVALRRGRPIPSPALADTTRWVERPGRWDRNGGRGPFSDRKLASLQFAATLAESHQAGLAKDKRSLELAGRLVASLQDEDGSWRVLPSGTLGASTTHGTALATHLARRTLRYLDARRYAKAITRADAWLRKAPVDTIVDAAATLLALGRANDAAAVAQKKRCLEQVREGERRDGGWGPWVRSPAEVFDTAVVLLALAEQEQSPRIRRWIQRGRAYLLAAQEKDGHWQETTRPPGAESFAQRLSTTGWAALALLATSAKR